MSAAVSAPTDLLYPPLPAWSPRAWKYAAWRAFLRTAGRLSAGARIGRVHGFDSGVMLDYVYADTATGTGPLGRLIDRMQLDAPGWRGIRARGDLLRAAIARAATAAAAEGRTPLLADLACGGARPVLSALADLAAAGTETRAVLRDYRPENLAIARRHAAALHLDPVIEQADAFSDTALAALATPDIVVVSGLHEIVADDATVRRHFHQIARLLPPGGRFILTVQPIHPQAEFIARVLTSHTGRPWAMRLRPLALTQGWAEEAGFAVEQITMESQGIFGVLEARRG